VTQIAAAADRRLAWEFFVLFSRFEYALKRSGFLKLDKQVAEANWDGFAMEVQDSFAQLQEPRFLSAVKYYQEHPPRKQLQQDGSLQWSEPLRLGHGEKPLVYLCRAVSLVRNNLAIECWQCGLMRNPFQVVDLPKAFQAGSAIGTARIPNCCARRLRLAATRCR
jgi:hypothetical protein